MPKYNKVYPSFYNGISQQIPELMVDSQCEDMVNCIPDIVTGVTKRPPATYVTHNAVLPVASKIVHVYDRGEDEEEYIFVGTGDSADPLKIFDKTGVAKTLSYGTSATTVKNYLTPTTISNLKGLTVQDRTFMLNKEEVVGISETIPAGASTLFIANCYANSVIITNGLDYNTIPYTVHFLYNGVEYTSSTSFYATQKIPYDITSTVQSLLTTLINANLPSTVSYDGTKLISDTGISTFNIWVTNEDTASTLTTHDMVVGAITEIDGTSTNTAFYWLKRSSGDTTNEYRYAVYLDGTLYQTTDSQSDVAVGELAVLINASANFTASYKGSTISGGNVLKIVKNDGTDFTFEWWDSWGSQASFGWKSSVSKLSDLPSKLDWSDITVEVTGDDNNEFTTYYVKSTDTGWVETTDPFDARGSLTNMPIAIDRQSDGTFLCSIITWEAPLVGDTNTNPTPSFVGNTLNDLFFYKNRLGVTSEENVVLSETGGYYNFYIKTVLNILDTDPIDIAIASTKTSKIQYAKPFQGSLYIFTKDSQFELASAGSTTPTTVSIEPVSSYPMKTDVAPVVSGNSLFFISITHNKQQLREYRKNNDSLTVTGIDLNISTPTLMDDPIQKILVNGVLGYVFCTTLTNEVYLYSFKENSAERVQSAWSRWEFYQGVDGISDQSFEYEILDDLLIVVYKTATQYNYNTVELAKDSSIDLTAVPIYPSQNLYPSNTLYPSGQSLLDTTDTGAYNYKSEIKLPKWYPNLGGEIKTPKDKILLKKITIEGEGRFDASVYRKDYNTTYSKTHEYTTIQDFDLYVNSKVDRCDIYISDSTSADFVIRSFVVEGLFSPTSKQLN